LANEENATDGLIINEPRKTKILGFLFLSDSGKEQGSEKETAKTIANLPSFLIYLIIFAF